MATNNNNNDGNAIEGWNTLANEIGSIFVFDLPDWRSDEGKRIRTKLEGLLAKAVDYSNRYAYLARLEFDPAIQTAVDEAKAAWNVIDADAVAPLSDTIVVTQQPNTVQSVESASGSRSVRGGRRKPRWIEPRDSSSANSSRRPPPPRRAPIAASQPIPANRSKKRKGEDPEHNSDPSSGPRPPPPQQALIAASQPMPANRSKKRVRKGEDPEHNSDPSSSHRPPAPQQHVHKAPKIRQRQRSEGNLAVTSVDEEDVVMTEANVRRQSSPPSPPLPPPPPSKIRVSSSCDLFAQDPLDAIRHLSIAPEQSRPADPTYPTVFGPPLNREDLEKHMETVAAKMIELDAAMAKTSQALLAESKKWAKEAHHMDYLQKVKDYYDLCDK